MFLPGGTQRTEQPSRAPLVHQRATRNGWRGTCASTDRASRGGLCGCSLLGATSTLFAWFDARFESVLATGASAANAGGFDT